jgi:CPA2 family monovalent cation:H+ antiporter-2
MEAIHFIQDLAIILAVAAASGWICQRLGLSTVVGYLVAGVVVGPFTPPLSLITDIPRIETLAQVGLIFLMFAIGLRLSVRKLRRLGPALLLSVAISSSIIFVLTRLGGTLFGLGRVETLFLAGMLMISSSAIISKVLIEAGNTHEKSSQLAMGVVVLEDIVAVVMLTLLNSIVQFGEAQRASSVGETLGMLGAFVVTAGIAGMLIVPWLLRRMSVVAVEELQTLGLAGLLFGLALLAEKAGYSIALGAFLLGIIVAETPHRAQVDRIFEGMRDVFTAIFFVAIGLQIDPAALASSALPILGLTVFTLCVRSVACSIGLTLTGTPFSDSIKTGLLVMPIGEFSFIIAQLGVASKQVPDNFYPIAVGVSLLTTFVAPFAVRHNDRITTWITRHHTQWMEDWLAAYHGWLERFSQTKQRNLFWQLSRKRIIQIALGMIFVTGLFLFSEKLLGVVIENLGQDWLFPHGPDVVFWLLLTLVTMAPLVAIWRNLSAMAMLYAQMTFKGLPPDAKIKGFVEHGLKVLAGTGLAVWLASILPIEAGSRWLLLMAGVLALAALLFLRRKLILWHSEAEVELQSILSASSQQMTATSAPWLQSHLEWNLAVFDCVLPDLADCQGRSIRDLKLRSSYEATIAGIERQGYMIPLPGPDMVLYPRDKLLLLGTPEKVRIAATFLQRVSMVRPMDSIFEDVRMEKITLEMGAPAVGQNIGTVAPARRFGIQLAGLYRKGVRMLNPSAVEILAAGDELLAMGTASQIREFKAWLNSRPGDEA